MCYLFKYPSIYGKIMAEPGLLKLLNRHIKPLKFNYDLDLLGEKAGVTNNTSA